MPIAKSFLTLRFFHPVSGSRRKEASMPATAMVRLLGTAGCCDPPDARCSAAAAAFTLVAMVRVEVEAAVPLGVTLAGLKEQVE
jgi:hypothetical protein